MTTEAKAGGSTAFTLAVASGKGGTGKTLVATNAAVMAAAAGMRVTLVDCDVEAPNDHLFLERTRELTVPVEVLVAEVDSALCTACGACRDACAYGAVRMLGGTALVFEELCHGCGLCSDVCPAGAILEPNRRVGEVVSGAVSGREGLDLVTGRLDIGQVKTPAVIRSARRTAEASPGRDLLILDAPPGVACAAVAAIRGADALLLVTEPTAFGLHDLELSVRLGRDLGMPMGIVVNRDVADGGAVERFSETWGVPIVARIPFSRRIAEVYARGGLVTDELSEIAHSVAGLVETMRDLAVAGVVAR